GVGITLFLLFRTSASTHPRPPPRPASLPWCSPRTDWMSPSKRQAVLGRAHHQTSVRALPGRVPRPLGARFARPDKTPPIRPGPQGVGIGPLSEFGVVGSRLLHNCLPVLLFIN